MPCCHGARAAMTRLCHAHAALQAFLNSSSVKAALNQTTSALAAITVLKKVCVHPALLTDCAASQAARGGGAPSLTPFQIPAASWHKGLTGFC